MNTTRRNKPHGSLQPILTPPILFHTISIDFILALPQTVPDGFDSVLTITEKMSKAVTIISGKTNWTAQQWGNALIYHLLLILWVFLVQIILDREPEFLSQIWKSIFETINAILLFSTSWYSNTDGASERKNQQIRFSFRYFIATLTSPPFSLLFVLKYAQKFQIVRRVVQINTHKSHVRKKN